ncbi:phosphate uptake regulator PhoU [Haladaptatus sp. DYF46]|uniref:phosphate signaling complex PhoU family protein n=1 Tax=Haladaptatus sp. DYF46 TaxID=2886041 RepID=UPI001E52B210|nr:phosphate uptake regulator PhoU [Haladaptatus sp. DYF46]
METRKIQITGGSTYTVSLPKGWAKRNDVTEGSVLGIHPDEHTLILAPTHIDNSTEGHLDVTDSSDEELVRSVIAMYVSGFERITLEMDRVTTDVRRAIRSATKNLAGLEVVEEKNRTVTVQVLFDASQFSISNTIARMQVIALGMLNDAITALKELDCTLARDVVDRDNDVDRLWFVISRMFRKSLRTPTAVEELGLPRERCFDFYTGARQLERIADHAAKIGTVAIDLETIPEDVAESVTKLHEETQVIINTAIEALLTDDREDATRLANRARDSVSTMDEHIRAINGLLRNLDSRHAQQLRLGVDSLSRCADYGGNLAEAALQKAAPRP